MAADWRDALSTIPDLRVKWDQPLARYTSFKIGGPADALVWADNRDQLRRIAALVRENNARLLMLGRGSNMLFSDAGFRGIVCKLGRDFENIDPSVENGGSTVTAGGGVAMSVFAKECAKLGLSGAEFMFGIPGSLGGGARMNAGAHGSDFSEIVVSAEALSWNGDYVRLDHDALKFEYRTSIIGEYVCATEMTFSLTPDDAEAVDARTKEYYYQRLGSQPLALPSAGCVFRNPSVGAAGKIIDELGLKGLSVGGARVSEKHANYMVGSDGATARDVIELIGLVKRLVKERMGTELELEIKIIEAE